MVRWGITPIRATKLISSISHLSYPARIVKLGLPSLEHRRLREVKLIHGLYQTAKPKLQLAEAESGTKFNVKKLFPHHCNGDIKKKFFSEGIISTRNSLPNEMVLVPSVNSFKGNLDDFWINKPEMYNPSCQ